MGPAEARIGESNPEHRKQAIMAIGSIGPAPEVITILNESLRDKDITIRQATAALMGELKYPGNVPNLQAALDDDSEVASQAAKSLWNMGDRSGRKVLEALYTGQERGGPNMIESAMRDAKDKLHHPKKLATMGVNEASGALLGPFSMGIIVAEEAMKDSGAPGRALAVNLLAQDCDARAAQLMEWALDNDKSTLVRAATAKALGKCGNISTIPKLMLLHCRWERRRARYGRRIRGEAHHRESAEKGGRLRPMKSYRKELWFEIPDRRGYVNITGQVEECLRDSGVREGLVLVNAMHITASVFINDDESGLHQDFEKWLEGLAPHEPVSGYMHNRTGEDNADAHLKRSVMGREVVVAITAGKLDFGPWEQIFYGEFDGRPAQACAREDHRRVIVRPPHTSKMRRSYSATIARKRWKNF